MKKVLLSYDYELYFNDFYFNECDILINPSDLIFDAYLKSDIRCTFFVDTECIIKYKQYRNSDFVTKVESQLLKFVKNGFDIQLHLHPLWEYAKFENEKWIFDYQKYDIKEFDINEIEKMIIRGKDYLEKLLRKEQKNYKCQAFRAGGFCIPNNRAFCEMLKRNEIIADTSIIPNAYLNSRYQKYNFFGGNKILATNSITEIPVLSAKKLNFYYLLNRKRAIISFSMRGKSSPVVFLDNRFKRKLVSIKESALITLDTHNWEFIDKCVKRYKYNILSILGHPKFENEETVNNTYKLITNTKDKYEFLTFSELIKIINTQ